MAQSYITDAGTLIIPGAYSQIKVQTANSGLATNGVLMLVGESDAGPRFSLEQDLELNAFGPDQLAAVSAKYGSGPLVDAFRAAAAPANDPNIAGSPSSIILVKTNNSTKASLVLAGASGSYGTLFDKSYGKLGNLIYVTVVAAASEVLPTTSSFTYIPAVGTVNYGVRANGGSSVGGTLSANTSPTAFVSAVDGLAGVAATGGVNRAMVSAVTGTLLVDANPSAAGATVVDFTRSVNWETNPTVGDTLVVPMGSVIAGAGNANVGAYVITAVTATNVRATKLSDAGKSGGVPGTLTNPVDVTPAVAITATTDIQAFSPVTITLEAGSVINGVGKSLEINELSGGTDLLSRTAYLLGTTTVVTWVSKTGVPIVLVSGTEYRATLTANRQVDNVSEELTAGGDIAVKIGYLGTTASLVVSNTTLTTTVTGGSGSNLSLTLKDFPTLSDLVTFINSQTGYSASLGTAVLGLLPTTALDDVTMTIASTFGAQTGRLKVDGYKFFNLINTQSVLVQLGNPAAQANAGLPAVAPIAYLSGGLKGASASSDFTAAIDALESVRGNFLIPLVSRDAAGDIADGLTESGSTYAIDAVNAYAKTHCLRMSTMKRRRNRQAFCSIETNFTAACNAAANLASNRTSLTFQDFKQTASDGSLAQFQPWMGAVLAAGMQAAGFYRAIVNKGVNTSGVLSRDMSFNDKNDTQVETALQSGLLPCRRSLTGGFTWISDQTTYGKDGNFVFNSIQAVYVSDVIALSTAQRMEAAIVGQSVADISAAIGLSFLEGIMADFLRLKLIAPSDDAPKGFKNAVIQISGNAMIVSIEIKLAGALYFIPINFLVSPVQQSAGQ